MKGIATIHNMDTGMMFTAQDGWFMAHGTPATLLQITSDDGTLEHALMPTREWRKLCRKVVSESPSDEA